nr:hypothetical protein [Streptomyces sp. 1331.2]
MDGGEAVLLLGGVLACGDEGTQFDGGAFEGDPCGGLEFGFVVGGVGEPGRGEAVVGGLGVGEALVEEVAQRFGVLVRSAVSPAVLTAGPALSRRRVIVSRLLGAAASYWPLFRNAPIFAASPWRAV